MANKSILLGGGDGTAVPAGMVGEIKTGAGVRSFLTNSATATGWALTDSITELTLTPGVWLVITKLIIEVTAGSTSGQRVFVLTTDTTDGWAPTNNSSTAGAGINITETISGGSIAYSTTDIITVTTNKNIRGKIYAATHTEFSGKYEIATRAIRIA